MILLDPDLDSTPAPRTSAPKRLTSSAQRALDQTLNQQAILRKQQRIPTAPTLARFLREAQSEVKLRGQVTVLLSTDKAIRRLNRQFRGKNHATDVLSFPADTPGPHRIAGDLAISIPTARRQAEERGHSLTIEIKVLMLHGLLHLAGYDHETDQGQMARREQKLRARLRLPHGLIERTVGSHVSEARSGAPSIVAKRKQTTKGARP
jgi:probable rRNA maturation factor